MQSKMSKTKTSASLLQSPAVRTWERPDSTATSLVLECFHWAQRATRTQEQLGRSCCLVVDCCLHLVEAKSASVHLCCLLGALRYICCLLGRASLHQALFTRRECVLVACLSVSALTGVGASGPFFNRLRKLWQNGCMQQLSPNVTCLVFPLNYLGSFLLALSPALQDNWTIELQMVRPVLKPTL